MPAGTSVRHYATLASTNAEAMRLASAGEVGPLWVTADQQTSGKGRSGREWVGQSGNLFASRLLTTAAPLMAAHQLSLVAGVAVHEAVSALGLPRAAALRLKWPNDILLGSAKAGGILVETTALPGRGMLTAVVGIGLNLATHPEIPGREVTSLGAHGCMVTPAEALAAIDAMLTAELALWDDARGFAATRARWLQRAGPLGERLSIHGPDGTLTGTFAGLDSDGALFIVLTDGETRRCTYGDVTLGEDGS
jgi:BirA family biotin operon repressor/biotin-[acetyl-CoA-carboxylase] ligase